MCIHTYILLCTECVLITVATKYNCRRNICTQNSSGAKCWPDIYRLGPGLAMTGRIWQKVLQSSFQTGSSSNPIYFHIFFRIAFLQEAFIRNIIIPRSNYICNYNINNNTVSDNNLWKTARPYFAIQNSHGHAKGFLRSLWAIWACALIKVRQPWFRMCYEPWKNYCIISIMIH
jgi:hypothetical protein